MNGAFVDLESTKAPFMVGVGVSLTSPLSH